LPDYGSVAVYWKNKAAIAKALGHGVNDTDFLSLWNSEKHEIIYDTGEKIVKEEMERHTEMVAALIWQGLAIGRLESTIVAALGGKNVKNTSLETLPQILQKYVSANDPKREEEELFSWFMEK